MKIPEKMNIKIIFIGAIIMAIVGMAMARPVPTAANEEQNKNADPWGRPRLLA